jgi:tetratricopeptide (TPR) repeat protein
LDVERKPILLTRLALILGIVAAVHPVEAQESAFLAVVSDLAVSPGDLHAARERMTTALAEWDRQIETLQRQVLLPGTGRESAFKRHLELGLAYRRRGRLDEALREFGAAASLQPGASDVHLLRALTFEAAGRVAEASEAFRAAWVRDAASPVKAYLVIRRTRDLDPADRERARDVLRRAYGGILSGDRTRAAPFLTVDLVPDTFSPTPIAGERRLHRLFGKLAAGRLDEAAAALSDGNPISEDDSALGRIARGRTAEREGRLLEARRDYTAALEGTLAGRHALHVGIARLAQVEGDLDGAIDAFEHAVRLSPNDPVLHREFAAALVAAGTFEDAFAELVAALLITPDEADVLAAVGQMFLDADRAEDAIAPLRRALAVKPDRHATHYALAIALSRAGRSEEAAREFERFERLNRQALEDRRRIMAGQAGLNETKR